MATTIVRHPGRTAAPVGSVAVAPGLIEVTGASRRPAAAEGWLGLSHVARRRGVDSLVVHEALRTGALPAYVIPGSRLRWCRAEDADRLHVRGVTREQLDGQGGTSRRLATEFYLPGEDPSGSLAR